MEKKTLSNILEGKIFTIPDYQRGYAWEEPQWKDFVQDIDALVDEKIVSHYTGTIVIYQSKEKPTDFYGIDKLEKVDVVDGQQRLTTSSLYLSIILKELIKAGKTAFKSKLSLLYSGTKCRLKLNNDTSQFFYGLITKGSSNVDATTVHQKRLFEAYAYLKKHIQKQLETKESKGVDYLKNLFDAVVRKLNFSFYPIEVESEIGMTFELMNSRGKGLSALELLKNYLMHWVYRNVNEEHEKENVTHSINTAWKEVYTNIAKCNGSENQCLRIAWTLYHSHTPKHWKGYKGFKDDDVIPLRDFTNRGKIETKEFIKQFTTGLAEISGHYAIIISPSEKSEIVDEYKWLRKIKNAGNIASFLPLLVAARINVQNDKSTHSEYLQLLKSLELFSYRVFLWQGKRSNTGLSKFYRWADDIFSKKHSVGEVTQWILGTINWYSNENSFRKNLNEEFYEWYHWRRLLRYTLYEYELWLLQEEGKDAKPKLKWSDLSDATFEHILPQNPAENSKWRTDWSQEDMELYLHDISNIVLTKDNSRYSNFEFDRKKGKSGEGYCYANSDIRQERKIARSSEWTAERCKERKKTLNNWIVSRWGIDDFYILPKEIKELEEEEDEFIETI
ncbi:MAG: hypothetical protein CMC13_14760 [Flavobacteriaceae bacterium]|nr:hypothetical protein [Flavobacteriaceae bacterium]|tara:strand:- start:66117 stop:67967 length:1851 start_codon:yes stop_codon:yes gene_type:complete